MRGFSSRRAGRRGGALLLPGSAAAFAALLMLPSIGSAQFAVYPIVLDLNAAAGDTVVQSVFVRNESNTVREFKFELQDFDQDSVGTPRFLAAGTHPHSCAARVQVYPLAATLAPGQTQELRVRFAGQDATCWSALFAEVRSTDAQGIVARQQIGVRINGSLPDAAREGEILRLQVEATSSPQLHLWFRNNGAVPVRPSGDLEIRDPSGEVVGAMRIDAFSVLPGATRRIALPLPERLPAGRFTIVPVLDFGGDYLAGAQTAYVVR